MHSAQGAMGWGGASAGAHVERQEAKPDSTKEAQVLNLTKNNTAVHTMKKARA